jgi:hypothetical protein
MGNMTHSVLSERPLACGHHPQQTPVWVDNHEGEPEVRRVISSQVIGVCAEKKTALRF